MSNTNYIITSDGSFISESELYHHGIKGMKWGVRRYQNPDGSLTPAGIKRLQKADGWANKVKAASFEASKNKKSKKENTGIWGFAAPISNSNKKSDSVWDRI